MKKNILIVDDFEPTRYISEVTLEGYGYDVLKASNGDEALKTFNSNSVDLVIADSQMSTMNGVELTKLIRRSDEKSHVPILILASDTHDKNKKEALAAGANAWLLKTHKTDSFIKTVKRTLLEN